eukprot:3750669-Amphidinium_carterae.1
MTQNYVLTRTVMLLPSMNSEDKCRLTQKPIVTIVVAAGYIHTYQQRTRHEPAIAKDISEVEQNAHRTKSTNPCPGQGYFARSFAIL